MKTLAYSVNKNKTVEIIIQNNYFNQLFEEYKKKYGVLFLFDTKIRPFLKKTTNIKFIKGGEDAKFLDKYIEVSSTIINEDIHILFATGGGSLLDLAGYSYNTTNFSKRECILFPTTLSSMIYLHNTGEFFLDMNYQKDILRAEGYPDKIIIDTNFYKSLTPQQIRKMFTPAYILSSIYDPTFARLTIMYANNFENLDLEDYLYRIYQFQTNLYSANENPQFPGARFSKLFYRKINDFKNDFNIILGCSYLFLCYISLNEGNIDYEYFNQVKEKLTELGSFDKKYIYELNLKHIDISISDFIPIRKGLFKEMYFTKEELRNYYMDFINFIRGE